jgi:hypothetical protein
VTIQEIAASLVPGSSAGFLLVEHVWARDLKRAIRDAGGFAPAASVRLLEAQMGGGRGGAVHGEDGVCELEEDIFPVVEASVERAAEGIVTAAVEVSEQQNCALLT